jgi:hypothetical protein
MTTPETLEPDDVTLLSEMVKLRAELRVSRRKELLWRVFVLVVILGGAYFYAGQKQTTDDILAARTEARAATCRSDNTFITNHNVLVDSVEQAAAVIAAPNPMRTPEQQAGADKFVADYTATVERARVPLRDCSPGAIAAFYKEKP